MLHSSNANNCNGHIYGSTRRINVHMTFGQRVAEFLTIAIPCALAVTGVIHFLPMLVK